MMKPLSYKLQIGMCPLILNVVMYTFRICFSKVSKLNICVVTLPKLKLDQLIVSKIYVQTLQKYFYELETPINKIIKKS